MLTKMQMRETFEKAMSKAGLAGEVTLSNIDVKPNGSADIIIRWVPKSVKPIRNVDAYKVGTVFQIKNRTYKVIGSNMRNWKYPISVVRRPDGRRFKVRAQSVIDGFLYVEGE